MKKLLSILIIVFAIIQGSAQILSGSIQKVNEDNFYKIKIPVEARSEIRNNLSYIRVKQGEKEVPYLEYHPKYKESDFIKFPLVEKKSDPLKTSFIIENTEGRKIEQIILRIANNDLEKKYSISGSNDQKEWFGLVNNQVVDGMNEAGNTSVEKEFRFPLNDYKYLKFDFADKDSLPINILAFGIYHNTDTVAESLDELSGFQQKITEDAKAHTTIIHIQFPTAQVIDGIEFTIKSPKLFSRNARIVTGDKENSLLQEVVSLELNSQQQNKFSKPQVYSRMMDIVIENNDNEPLTLEKIKLFQKPVYITAELHKDKDYTLLVDKKLSQPQYDLSRFENSIPSVQTEVQIAKMNFIHDDVTQSNNIPKEKWWQTRLFMWGCIIIAILVIGYFAVTLMKDMSKS